jgi:hypothetical protein
VEAKKNFSPFNCSAIRHLFIYEAWLGTSHSQQIVSSRHIGRKFQMCHDQAVEPMIDQILNLIVVQMIHHFLRN